MTDLFIAVLVLAVAQRVLGLGNWVWLVAALTSLIDTMLWYMGRPD